MPIVLLLFLCLAVFARSLTGEFLNWDDAQHITQNPWLLAGDIGRFWQMEYFGFYIPVAYTIWAWVWQIWPSPMAFHILNLLLHFLNSVMVFVLARKILSSSNMRGLDERAKDHTPFALFTAAIFAIHPLQVETVAWISGGRDVMAAFFGLAAVLAAWNTSDRLFPTWSATIRRGFATILFILGLLCKPGIIVLPLAVRWLSWFSERRGLKPFMMAVWIMLALVAAGWTSQLQEQFVKTRIPEVPIWQKPLVAADAVLHYLVKYFVPLNLSADYGRTPAVALEQGRYWWLLLAVVIFFLVLGVLAAFHRKPPRSFWGSLGFFLILISPTLGFVGFAAQDISTVFDRYMYLPSIGLSLAIAAVFTTAKVPKMQIRYAIALVFFLLCTLFSVSRVPVWKTNRALSADTVAKNPRSYHSLVNLAIADLNDKNLPAALENLTRARELKPDGAVAWANLAHVYWLTERTDRIREEVLPLLSDSEFLLKNRHEHAALSLLWRISARIYWKDGRLESAREAYCQARQFNRFDQDLLDETTEFRAQNPNLPDCAAL